jgi:hypothetical protein
LGQGITLVSSSVFVSTSTCNFHSKTLLYQNLNQNCNIFYSENVIYGLYVCTCAFLLHQESFDMILVNNPSFYDGVLHFLRLKRKRDREIDLENRRELLSLRGGISPSLLIHGRDGLDHVRGHRRALAKPHELGVYDSGGVGYLSCAQGSCISCSGREIRPGVCGILRARTQCAITLISPLSTAILCPGATSLDPLGDVAYGGLHDPVRGLYGD